MALLQLKHVSSYLGARAACADVSFYVQRGTVVGLVGPSGAGKATLLDCVSGFRRPDRGEVRFKGLRLNGLSPDRISRLGLCRTWRRARPLADRTALDEVMVGAFARHRRREAAREEALEQLRVVGLEARAQTPAAALSVLERKRLALARALATRPELLLLDEVMDGLDPAEVGALAALVLSLKQAGLTVLAVEHDLEAVLRISDKVVVLRAGEKLCEGRPAEVMESREVAAAFLGEAP